jgi:hypothetical protein
MRQKLYFCLISLLAGSANAHTIGADASLAETMGHQLFASHHLPQTVLLVLIGLIVVARAGRYVASRNRETSMRSR